MLAGQAPGSLAVAGEIDGRQRFAHRRTLVGKMHTGVEVASAARVFAKLYDEGWCEFQITI
jgi:hypothetical protein